MSRPTTARMAATHLSLHRELKDREMTTHAGRRQRVRWRNRLRATLWNLLFGVACVAVLAAAGAIWGRPGPVERLYTTIEGGDGYGRIWIAPVKGTRHAD